MAIGASGEPEPSSAGSAAPADVGDKTTADGPSPAAPATDTGTGGAADAGPTDGSTTDDEPTDEPDDEPAPPPGPRARAMPEPPDLIPAELAALRPPVSAAPGPATPAALGEPLPRRGDGPARPIPPGPHGPHGPATNPTRRDFLLAGLVAVVLVGGLLLLTTRPWDRLAAGDAAVGDTSCRNGVVQAVLTPSSTVEGNVHIRLSTRLTVPVTITELFLRSPSISGEYDGVVNPPDNTVISLGHPYDWDVFLQTPVTGTIIGIHKEPYGINAIHATWTAADGTKCDRVG